MKNLVKLTLLLMTVMLLGYSCKSAKAQKAQAQSTDLTGSWVLKTMNGEDVATLFKGKVPAMNIDAAQKKVSGNSGCNTFSGMYVYEGGSFSVPKAAVTMMACMDANQEPQFLKILSTPTNLLIEDGVLKLTDQGKVVAEFVKGIDVNALSGSWKLKSLNGEDVTSKFKNVPTLEFRTSENKLGGNGGCNRYNASYSLIGSEIKVGPVMSTRMACDDLANEEQFTKAISDASTLSLNGNQLLFVKDGKTVLVFAK